MLKQLETQGFCIIKGWLNATEQARAMAQYQAELARSRREGIVNKNYQVLQDPRPHGLDDKILKLLEQVRARTDLTTDWPRPQADYFDNQMVTFGWHQDHEPYYQYQDTYNILNCWVPLIIPQGHSGLSLLPQHVLQAREPELWARFKGRGAKSLRVVAGRTIIRDDQEGDLFYLNWSIDDVAVTPDLEPGDLLLIRCDTIHRSMPPLGHRVSLSVRCLNSGGIITREHFERQCLEKRRMIMSNPAYKALKQQFSQVNSMSIGDWLKR
jgi:ectoine hydroxylase-related dioxygenase (phytanoyl-CoA dioxygenase family)